MNKFYKISGAVLIIALATLAIARMRPASGDIKIGVISPMTGLISGGSNLGENYANGVKLAIEDYKALHPGINISYVLEDDGYDSKKGVSAYQKLVNLDKVDALLNLSSPTIDAVYETARKDGLPIMQLGEQAQSSDDNIFQVYPGNKAAIEALGAELQNRGYQKIVVASQQLAAYERWVNDIKTTFKGNVVHERISPTENDLRPIALKVAQEKPDALVILMGSSAGAELVKNLHQQNNLPPLYLDTALNLGLGDFQKVLGSDLGALEGTVAVSITSYTSDDFKERYKAKYGMDAGALADYGYDSAMILLSSHDSNRGKWMENISNADYQGVSGRVSFEPDGTRIPEYKLVTVRSGAIVDLK